MLEKTLESVGSITDQFNYLDLTFKNNGYKSYINNIKGKSCSISYQKKVNDYFINFYVYNFFGLNGTKTLSLSSDVQFNTDNNNTFNVELLDVITIKDTEQFFKNIYDKVVKNGK